MQSDSDTNESVRKVEAFVPEIARRFGILRVSLFGSRSRGDYTEESDYDFLILCPTCMTFMNVTRFMDALRDTLGAEIDFTYEDFISEHFRSRIQPDLRLIYELQ